MDQLRLGDRRFTVNYLQRLLNRTAARGAPGPRPLAVDGIFGPLTQAALDDFQTRTPGLANTHIVDDATWRALGHRTDKIHHRVRLLGQPTGMTCWSAAASMILGDRSVTAEDADIDPSGGLRGRQENTRAFGRRLGWRMLDHTPGVQEMVSLVFRTPVWIRCEGAGWAHAVVLSGVYSSGDHDGGGTAFRIHDPWPPGQGSSYGSFADPIRIGGHVASLDHVLVPPH